MSAYTDQPKNVNPLASQNFKFQIKRTPHINYFCQRVAIPSINMQASRIPNPFVAYPVPGDLIDFEQLTIEFAVDEDLKNYLEIYNWLIGLGFPDKAQEFQKLSQPVLGGRDAYVNHNATDCSLFILTNEANPNILVTFEDAFPTSLGELRFESTNGTINPVPASATFAYRKFSIETT